tara:strand:+ start:2634 stop:3131 length:498 start_codon:yes stop_codon:yes gene_type:complete
MNTFKTPLIELETVQEYCGLSRNVTEKEYNRFILTSQNTRLRNLIGEEMVDDLVTYKDLGGEGDEDFSLLQSNYIEPFLSHDSFVQYSPQSSIKSTKSGVKKMKGENTENSSKDDLSHVSSINQKNADNFAKRMICFLEENAEKYPSYTKKEEPVLRRSIFTIKG